MRDVIDVPAVSVPHPGASYNPPVQAHEELLMETYKVEQRRQEKADRLLEARQKIERAHEFAANDVTEGVPAGMVIDEIKDDGVAIAITPAVVSKRLGARKNQTTACSQGKVERRGPSRGDL